MKYWVYHEGEVPGVFEAAELAKLPTFTAATLVCPADAPAAERRWQRAGEHADIVEALQAYDRQPPPLPPPQARAFADPDAVKGPDDLLDASSHKIFRHVTELMKELENRREERALIQSLQRSLVELKAELQAAREHARFLQDRVSAIPAIEEREALARREIERLGGELRTLEERLEEGERAKADLRQKLREADLGEEEALRAQAAAERERKRAAGELEAMNAALASREASLAKSLAVIRRLELELGQLLPPPESPPAALPDIPDLKA